MSFNDDYVTENDSHLEFLLHCLSATTDVLYTLQLLLCCKEILPLYWVVRVSVLRDFTALNTSSEWELKVCIKEHSHWLLWVLMQDGGSPGRKLQVL